MSTSFMFVKFLVLVSCMKVVGDILGTLGMNPLSLLHQRFGDLIGLP